MTIFRSLNNVYKIINSNYTKIVTNNLGTKIILSSQQGLPGAPGGVVSLNSKVGVLNLVSADNSVVITTPNATTINLQASTNLVTSVFGRTGAVTAQSGDYNTSQVTENGNLYFTNARAVSALTGQNISIFSNDVGYITSSALAPYLFSSTAAATYYPLTNPSAYISLTSLSAGTGISYNNTTGVITNSLPDRTVVLTNGTGISVTGTYPNFTITNTSPSSGGTVIAVSVATANGFAGTSSGGATPALTLSTTVTGILKGNGTGSLVGAIAGTDYQAPISLTTTGTSGAATFISNVLNIPQYASLGSFSASAPLSYNSSTGAFSISQATTSTNGYLSSTDWNTFNNKQAAISLTTTGNVGASSFVSNTLNIPVLSVYQARVATTGILNATYLNGTAGVGATLTNAGTQAALVIDGISLSVNDVVVVANQSSQFQNGIYIVSNIGSGSTNWVLTRAPYFDNSTIGNIVQGATTIVSQGTLNAGISYIQNALPPFTMGTTPITFIQNSATGSLYTFSTGLTNTANTITANLSTGISGGQSVIGDTAASGNLTLSSTSNATKGLIAFGNSAYNESTNRLGIGTTSPSGSIHVSAAGSTTIPQLLLESTSGSSGNVVSRLQFKNASGNTASLGITDNSGVLNILAGSVTSTVAGSAWIFSTSAVGGAQTNYTFKADHANSSGTSVGLLINPTGNNSSTGGLSALKVNPTGTYSGSGSQLILDLQAASVQKFTMGIDGSIVHTPSTLTGSLATTSYSLTPTWNTTGAPTALLVNITNTASNSNSRILDCQIGGTSYFYIPASSSQFITVGAGGLAADTIVNNTSTTTFNFLASGSLSGAVAGLSLLGKISGGSSKSFTASSGQQYGVYLAPTINQTSTAAFTALCINRQETANGSGNQYAIDVQQSGTSVFRLFNTGQIQSNSSAVFNTSLGVTGSLTTNPTTPTNGCFTVLASTNSVPNSAAGFQLGGATTSQFRTIFNGVSSAALAANQGFTSILMASNPVTAAATGTHGLLANLALKALSVTTSTSTITNTSTLYIDGAASGGVKNYALYVNSGDSSFSHITSNGSTPAILAGAGAGTSPTVSVSGTDLAGQITITTGTLPSPSATVATITFATAYNSAPKYIGITPANSNAAALGGNIIWADSAGILTTAFTLNSGLVGLAASTTYIFYYYIIQ